MKILFLMNCRANDDRGVFYNAEGDPCIIAAKQNGRIGFFTEPDVYGGGSGGNLSSQVLTFDQMREVSSHIEVKIDLDVENPWEALDLFWVSFWNANKYMTNEMYNYYTNNTIHINILSNDNFQSLAMKNSIKSGRPEDKDAIGFTDPPKNNNINISFPEKIFNKDFYIINKITYTSWNGREYPETIEITILHELGHGYGWYKNQDDYNKFYYSYKENWAIDFVNTNYISKKGDPTELLNPTNIFRKAWWMYGRNP